MSEGPGLDAAYARLHEAGLRLTGPRRRLVGLLASLGRWCTARELHDLARREGVRAGLATVYRLLEVLVAAGVCRPFVGPDRAVRYVYCPPGHHHHLICEGCGRVQDLPDCQVAPPPGGFAVERHVLDFFGRCAACADRRSPAGSGGGPDARGGA